MFDFYDNVRAISIYYVALIFYRITHVRNAK